MRPDWMTNADKGQGRMTRSEVVVFAERLRSVRASIQRINIAPGDQTMRDLICASLDTEICHVLQMLLESDLEAAVAKWE